MLFTLNLSTVLFSLQEYIPLQNQTLHVIPKHGPSHYNRILLQMREGVV